MIAMPPHQLADLFEEQLHALSATLRPGTIAANRSYANTFLRYLHRNYPELQTPSQLQRDPHMLRWLRSLAEKKPPFVDQTRVHIITCVRRLLNDLADKGYSIAENLILTQDIPYPRKPVLPEIQTPLAFLFKQQLHALSATLRPGTIAKYRVFTNGFLRYLLRHHPEVETPDRLQRNPHILGWLQSLAERNPPFANETRVHIITCMRRLFYDLADDGYPFAQNLIVSRDFPPKPIYLPRPVCPEVDELLKNELRKTDDLLSNALLLIRATGMRVGECAGLKRDCPRHLGGDHWALHVPVGKLHNERLVPMDKEARGILGRIIALSGPSRSNDTDTLLLLTSEGKAVSTQLIRLALKNAAEKVGCQPILPHQLRHTYATMMLRAGISLPALKQILGHRDIRMTMRYVQVTQTDLQREYALARQKMANIHVLPQLSTITRGKDLDGISSICTSLDEIRHRLQMYLHRVGDQGQERSLHALLRRLVRLRTSLSALIKQ